MYCYTNNAASRTSFLWFMKDFSKTTLFYHTILSYFFCNSCLIRRIIFTVHTKNCALYLSSLCRLLKLQSINLIWLYVRIAQLLLLCSTHHYCLIIYIFIITRNYLYCFYVGHKYRLNQLKNSWKILLTRTSRFAQYHSKNF